MSSNFFGRLFVNVVVIAAMYFVLVNIPSVAELQFSVHSFGWPIAAIGLVATVCISSYCAGFVKGLIGESAVSHPVTRTAGRVITYLFAGVLFAAGAVYFPAYFTLNSVAGLFWLLGGWGVAFTVIDMLEERFFPRS